MNRYFKKIGSTDYSSSWESKGLSHEIIKPSTTSDDSLAPALSYIDDETRVKFVGSCLKQNKITFNYGKTVNIYIASEINLWNYVDSSDPMLGNLYFVLLAWLKMLKLTNLSILDMLLDVIISYWWIW